MEWPPHLLCASDLTASALGRLLDLAEHMKEDAGGHAGALQGQALACFFDPPTTGAAFVAAVAAGRLGMHAVTLPRRELTAGSAEPLGDVVRNFCVTAAALLVHAVPQRVLRDVAHHATKPVINGLSEEHRPCQALADLLTLREHFGRLSGLGVAFLGDAGSGAAHSLLEAAALAGMEIRIACPPEHRPDPLVLFGAQAIAERHDSRVMVTDDPREAVRGAHAVYTAPWVPPGHEHERAERLERLRRFHIHPELMTLADKQHVFMHCLPARRGEEASAMVVDGGRSVIWEQAANRTHVQQATILSLVTGGAPAPSERASQAAGSPLA